MGRYTACSHPCDSAWLLFVGGTSTASFALRGSAWTPGAGAFASGGCAASWRNRPLKTIVETNTTDMMVFSFRRTCWGDVFPYSVREHVVVEVILIFVQWVVSVEPTRFHRRPRAVIRWCAKFFS